MSRGAPVSRVQVPVAGSNTSGTVALQAAQFTSPASASMRPSGKAVTVGYQRPTAIPAPDVHLCVCPSKIEALLIPTWLLVCPPATKILPSGSRLWPEQKRFAAVNGTAVTPSVDGSKTTAPVASVWSSHARTLPLGIRFMWIATRGQSRTCDQSPTTAGSVDVLLVTVMATPDDTVWLPAPSRARAGVVGGICRHSDGAREIRSGGGRGDRDGWRRYVLRRGAERDRSVRAKDLRVVGPNEIALERVGAHQDVRKLVDPVEGQVHDLGIRIELEMDVIDLGEIAGGGVRDVNRGTHDDTARGRLNDDEPGG